MHVYGVQNNGVHMVRLRFYTDKHQERRAVLKEVFQYAFTQGEFEMAGTVHISEAEYGQSFGGLGWI